MVYLKVNLKLGTEYTRTACVDFFIPLLIINHPVFLRSSQLTKEGCCNHTLGPSHQWDQEVSCPDHHKEPGLLLHTNVQTKCQEAGASPECLLLSPRVSLAISPSVSCCLLLSDIRNGALKQKDLKEGRHLRIQCLWGKVQTAAPYEQPRVAKTLGKVG